MFSTEKTLPRQLAEIFEDALTFHPNVNTQFHKHFQDFKTQILESQDPAIFIHFPQAFEELVRLPDGHIALQKLLKYDHLYDPIVVDRPDQDKMEDKKPYLFNSHLEFNNFRYNVLDEYFSTAHDSRIRSYIVLCLSCQTWS
jgi:hypothetical protein